MHRKYQFLLQFAYLVRNPLVVEHVVIILQSSFPDKDNNHCIASYCASSRVVTYQHCNLYKKVADL